MTDTAPEPSSDPAPTVASELLVQQEPEAKPLTVDELAPYFAGMPNDIGSLVRELAVTRYYLTAAQARIASLGG